MFGIRILPVGLRWTRRGRIVMGVLLAAMVSTAGAVVVALVATVAAADGGAGRPSRAELLSECAAQAESGVCGVVVVHSGDTLWHIAQGVSGDRDVRDVVRWVAELNGLSSAQLRVGQVLVVPVL